jgi:hypothetical protein
MEKRHTRLRGAGASLKAYGNIGKATSFATSARNAKFRALAVAVFLAGGLAGVALKLQDPDFQLQVLGPRMVQTIQPRDLWTHPSSRSSGQIMTNNIGVGLMAYATGAARKPQLSDNNIGSYFSPLAT